MDSPECPESIDICIVMIHCHQIFILYHPRAGSPALKAIETRVQLSARNRVKLKIWILLSVLSPLTYVLS